MATTPSWPSRPNWCGCCNDRAARPPILAATAETRRGWGARRPTLKPREQFLPARCLSRYALGRSAVRSVGEQPAGRAVSLPGTTVVPAEDDPGPDAGLAPSDRAAQLAKHLFLSITTSLVTMGGAFYNPSNTALGAVVWFTHAAVLNRQTERLQPPRASA
jgi:hypothetical protein